MKKILLLITISVIYSCSPKKEKISPEAEVNIIKQCLAVLEKQKIKGYVISPKYQKFGLNSFLREEDSKFMHDINKDKILDFLKWTENDFEKNTLTVNDNYLNKKNIQISKLSKLPINNKVIFFSGIHENLVFASIINYCNAVTKLELELDSFNKRQRYSDAADYAFIIKDGIVTDMIIDGGVIKEYQCNEKDKFIDENGKEIKIWEE